MSSEAVTSAWLSRLLYTNTALSNAKYNVRSSEVTIFATAFFNVPTIVSTRPLELYA